MEIKNKDLKRRIIEISYKHKLSHLGSCLTAVDIIKDIYDTKKSNEKFVLSQGHAGLALYVVLEEDRKKFIEQNSDITGTGEGDIVEKLLESCGIHPDRLSGHGYIDCSTGSLGQGLPIALGMALADRNKDVYCLISDGELRGEGSIHEALNIMREQKARNLKIYVNCNGYTGYGESKLYFFADNNIICRETNVDYLPFLEGLKGHYHVMSEDDYKFAMEVLK